MHVIRNPSTKVATDSVIIESPSPGAVYADFVFPGKDIEATPEGN